MRLDHVAFYVEDIDKCADFFIKHYKAKRTKASGNGITSQSQCMIRFDKGAEIELMHKPEINEKTMTMHPGLGYHHCAINVGSDENYEKTLEGLMDDGYIFLTGPRVNSFGMKEGIVLGEGGNLTIQTAPAMDDDPDYFFNHVGFFVKDNKEVAKFFIDYFGGKDNGCSKVNRKTGQDNYMVGFENCDIELMTCPNMIPEPDNKYEKLGFAHVAIETDSEEQYDEVIARFLNNRYQALQGPRVDSMGCKQAILRCPGNIAVQLICKRTPEMMAKFNEIEYY